MSTNHHPMYSAQHHAPIYRLVLRRCSLCRHFQLSYLRCLACNLSCHLTNLHGQISSCRLSRFGLYELPILPLSHPSWTLNRCRQLYIKLKLLSRFTLRLFRLHLQTPIVNASSTSTRRSTQDSNQSNSCLRSSIHSLNSIDTSVYTFFNRTSASDSH